MVNWKFTQLFCCDILQLMTRALQTLFFQKKDYILKFIEGIGLMIQDMTVFTIVNFKF